MSILPASGGSTTHTLHSISSHLFILRYTGITILPAHGVFRSMILGTVTVHTHHHTIPAAVSEGHTGGDTIPGRHTAGIHGWHRLPASASISISETIPLITLLIIPGGTQAAT